MFTRSVRSGAIGTLVALALAAVTACSTQSEAVNADGGAPGPESSAPASTTTRSSAAPQPDAPERIDVPEVFLKNHDVDKVAGTYKYPGLCSPQQMTVSVFDTASAKVVSARGPKDEIEADGETISSVKCEIYRLDSDELYITYGVNSYKDASGLDPLREFSRAYTYALNSTTPSIIEFDTEISRVVGSTSGPVIQTLNQDRENSRGTYTISRYDVDGDQPEWTVNSTDFSVVYSDSPSVTLQHYGDRRVLDAGTGEELLQYCSIEGDHRRNTQVAVYMPISCEPYDSRPPTNTFEMYDLVHQRQFATLEHYDKSELLPDTSQDSDEYIVFFDKFEPSLIVLDKRTGDTVIDKIGDEAKDLNLEFVHLFADHLYLTTNNGTTSAVALPGGETVAGEVDSFPRERFSGWTRTTAGDGQVLVRDVDGRFPGPWY